MRVLEIRLQTEQHHHIRPIVAGTVFEPLIGTEVSIGPLAGQRALHPDLAFVEHFRVVKDICQLDISFQPIWKLLPSVLSLPVLAQPRVSILLQPRADLAEMPGEPLALPRQLLADPTPRFHRPRRQQHQPHRLQRRAVAHIQRISRRDFRRSGRLDAGTAPGHGKRKQQRRLKDGCFGGCHVLE